MPVVSPPTAFNTSESPPAPAVPVPPPMMLPPAPPVCVVVTVTSPVLVALPPKTNDGKVLVLIDAPAVTNVVPSPPLPPVASPFTFSGFALVLPTFTLTWAVPPTRPSAPLVPPSPPVADTVTFARLALSLMLPLSCELALPPMPPLPAPLSAVPPMPPMAF